MDFTLENQNAALLICLPTRCGIGTQLKLSPDLQPSFPPSPFLWRPVLSGVGVEPLGSDTFQEVEAAEEKEDMCPVIGLLSSFCIFFPLSFISGFLALKKIKRKKDLDTSAWQKEDWSWCWIISFSNTV